MAWFKIDDKFHTHPKVVTAGNAAVGLWCRLGAWASDHLTDGHVPAAVARVFGTETELAALVETGLLVATDTGYQFADWLDYNPSAAEVAEARQRRSNAASTAGQRSANARATKRQRTRNETSTTDEPAGNENSTPHPHPYPYPKPQTQAGAHQQPVENPDSRTAAIIDAYVTHLVKQNQQRGTRIANMDAYRQALATAAANHPDLHQLANDHPTAPAGVIAAAMHGETQSLHYYRPTTTEER